MGARRRVAARHRLDMQRRVKLPPDWDRELRKVVDSAEGGDLISKLRDQGGLFYPIEFERIGSD
jgi:hypothetical protein